MFCSPSFLRKGGRSFLKNGLYFFRAGWVHSTTEWRVPTYIPSPRSFLPGTSRTSQGVTSRQWLDKHQHTSLSTKAHNPRQGQGSLLVLCILCVLTDVWWRVSPTIVSYRNSFPALHISSSPPVHPSLCPKPWHPLI